jgi:hypothetical protein
VKFNLHQSDANPDLYELHEDREGKNSYVKKAGHVEKVKTITLNGTEKTSLWILLQRLQASADDNEQ